MSSGVIDGLISLSGDTGFSWRLSEFAVVADPCVCESIVMSPQKTAACSPTIKKSVPDRTEK
jgi:hypothetical protein